MRAWQVVDVGRAEFGTDVEPPSLPTDDPHATLVEVHAAAANFADRLMIDGKYQLRPRLPFVPGFELAGVVTATGSDRLRAGDRVAGVALPDHGSWAEVAVADARHLTVLPDDLGWVDAVGLHVNAQTAWFALHRAARVDATDVVLVHAAAGGVGSMAVQLAVAAGCRVVGTASAGKLDRVRALGAQLAVDNRSPGWPTEVRDAVGEVDVVIDPVGAEVFAGSWRLLGFEGRYVAVGFTSGGVPSVRADQALVRNLSFHGMYWTPHADRHPSLVDEAAGEIFGRWRAGRLDPCVMTVAPLDEALTRVDDVAAGRTVGKSVLTIR
jgi:NADPH2:quinone reductase